MKLPRAGFGTIQRLTQPDIAQEAASATLGIGVAQTLVGTAGKAAHIFDLNRATTEANNALRSANELQRFLTPANINLNDPLVSDETRRAVLANNDAFDATRVSAVGDKYMVPSEWVGTQMMEEYAKRIREGADALSRSQRPLYDNLVKDSVLNTFNKVQLQIKKAEIDSAGRAYEELQDQLIDQGLFDQALDVGTEAFNFNFWDDKKLEKRQKEVYKMGQEYLEMRLDTLNNEAQAAIRSGNRGTAEAIREQYVFELNKGETYGQITRDEYNEHIQDFDKAAEFEATRRDAIDIYLKHGLGASQKYMRERRQKVPEYYDGHEWTVDMNKIHSEVVSYQEDANRLAALMKDRIKLDKAYANINGALSNSHLLSDTPDNRKDANLVYNASRDAWYAGGIQNFIDQATNFILKTGLIPSDLEAEMNAGMMSKDWQAAQNVMQLYNRVKDNNAALLGQLDDKPAAFYTMLSRASRVFGEQDFEQAYNSVHEALYTTPDIVNQRRGEYVGSFKKKGKSMKKRMDTLMDKFDEQEKYKGRLIFERYKGELEKTPEIEADYRNLERVAYILTGDLDTAQEMATQRMLASYSPWILNGRAVLMRNAPDVDRMPWAPKQYKAYVKNRWPELVETYGEDAFELVSREGANFRLGEPAYGIRFINPKNMWDRDMLVDPETGNEALWRPDFKQTQEYKDQVALKRRLANSAQYLKQKYNESLEFFKRQEAQRNLHANDFGLGFQFDSVTMDMARRMFLDSERIKGDDILYEKSKKVLEKAQEDAQKKEKKQEDLIRQQIEAEAAPKPPTQTKPMTSRIPAKKIL